MKGREIEEKKKLMFIEGLCMLSTFSPTISFNLNIFTDEETGGSEYLSNLGSSHYKRNKWDLTSVKLWVHTKGQQIGATVGH